ncbi:MAG: hypothetical protein QG551_217 [Patescibacteria group bacterium]|nr:hypothetical protein [Patescibacteria group bacterium]
MKVMNPVVLNDIKRFMNLITIINLGRIHYYKII